GFLYTQAVTIMRRIDSTSHCAGRRSKQAETTGLMSEVKAERAAVQTRAAADPKSRHTIFVIANEKERCFSVELPAFNANVETQKWISPKREHGRPRECRPFTAIELLLPVFAVDNDARINPEARIVDEHATVDLCDINQLGMTVCDR